MNSDYENGANSNYGRNYSCERKDRERFSEWIHCMCVVTFDLELGQAIELIYPESTLSEQEKTNICYLAFPDSNSGCMGDTQFHIRLRLSPDNADGYQLKLAQNIFNSQCIAVQKADLVHYWGFVYFRQKKDTTITRGYFQKSFIILSRLPFYNLFTEIVSQVAPRYFNDGLSVLETVYRQISKWPSLKAGEDFSLGLLNTVYQTFIPKSSSKSHSNTITVSTSVQPDNANQIKTCSNDFYEKKKKKSKNCNENNEEDLRKNEIVSPNSSTKVLTSVHEINIFRSLSHHVPNLYLLWELVLTGEPIVIMGSSPSDCSHMVQSLISLISPLAYLSEFRPYFTIHDSEFHEFTNTKTRNNINTDSVKNNLIPSIIIGVTNPFFCKLLQNWPHMIKLPDTVQPSYAVLPNYALSSINSDRPVALKKKNLPNASTSISYVINNTINSNDVNTHGLHTKYKSFLKKDKSLIKKIQLGIKTKRPKQVQSALLRRHFLELTQSFMIPLERYMASLMPLQKDISPFKSAPNPSQFKQDDFLATLEFSGPHLTSPLKGDWTGLYKKFFKSANFKGWFENRYRELKHTLQSIQLQALSDADLNQWAQGKQEVEIIDMILKLKQKLQICSDPQLIDDILKPTTKLQLIKQIDDITKSLPDDLQNIINDTAR